MQDRYGHRISYLRVSITDRCNERCTYCMPQELREWLPREEILTFEETLRLIRIAAELGVSKVQITGRDFHEQVLRGIDAAIAADFEQIKLNTVLMRGRNEDQLIPLIEFAASRGLILRFIEMMPVSTTEVLDDKNFMPVREAKRIIESRYGVLIPEAEFRTNGPATYYQIPGRPQRIGFIGAMTNLHFCESCNKLRLTCDGKLRPCLGS